MTADGTAADNDAVLSILANLAALDLPQDRVDQLSPLLDGIRLDYDSLRSQPREIEPHIVFDPRWD